MKAFSRILALLLCVLLLIGAAGCGADTSWVSRYDGDEVPAGMYIQYLLLGYQEAENLYLEEKYTGADADEVWVYPSKSELLASEIEGQNAADWIVRQARDNIIQYYGAKALAAEMNLSLGSSGIYSAATNTENYWGNYETYYTKNGVARSSLEQYFTADALMIDLLNAIYGPQGSSEVPERDLLQLLSKDYAKAGYVVLYKESAATDQEDAEETARIDAQNAQLKAQAEEYAQRLADGEAVVNLLFEYQLTNAAAGLNLPSQDQWELMLRIKDVEGGYYALYDEILKAAPGSSGVVEEDYLFYVYYRYDLSNDTATMAAYRETLLLGLKGDEFKDMLLEKGNALDITMNESAFSSYQPKNLTIES